MRKTGDLFKKIRDTKGTFHWKVGPSHQEASLASYPSEGRQTGNHNYRKVTKLTTWITALSNSMKLWTRPCWATQDGRVMVESSEQTWSIREGNGNPLQYSCLANPMNSMKRQKDMGVYSLLLWFLHKESTG